MSAQPSLCSMCLTAADQPKHVFFNEEQPPATICSSQLQEGTQSSRSTGVSAEIRVDRGRNHRPLTLFLEHIDQYLANLISLHQCPSVGSLMLGVWRFSLSPLGQVAHRLHMITASSLCKKVLGLCNMHLGASSLTPLCTNEEHVFSLISISSAPDLRSSTGDIADICQLACPCHPERDTQCLKSSCPDRHHLLSTLIHFWLSSSYPSKSICYIEFPLEHALSPAQVFDGSCSR